MVKKLPFFEKYMINENILQREIQTKDGIGIKISNDILDDEFCELVPVEDLIRMRDFDRTITYKYSREDSESTIERLKQSFLKIGLISPVRIDYYQFDKKVLMSEGNHRLNAAIDLGLKFYPATVYSLKIEIPESKKDKGLPVQGYKEDEYGYVPENLKPSDVGIISMSN